ncbi:hypothetical protein [Rheinheimera gaetbuli]
MKTIYNLLTSYSGQYHADDIALVVICCAIAIFTRDLTTACDIGLMYCFSKIY